MKLILNLSKEISDKIPNEIIEKIITYRISYVHKLNFNNSLNLIPIYSIFFKIKFLNKIYKERNYRDDFLDIILEFTSYNERIEMIKILNTCKCCKKHQIRKPTLKQFLEGFVPNYSTRNQKNKQCKCKCRSFCRDLCRAQNDEIDESL